MYIVVASFAVWTVYDVFIKRKVGWVEQKVSLMENGNYFITTYVWHDRDIVWSEFDSHKNPVKADSIKNVRYGQASEFLVAHKKLMK